MAEFSVSGTLATTAQGPATFSAVVTSNTEDPEPGNNTVTETTEIDSVALADLKLTVSEDKDPVAPGSSVIYTVTVENLGPDEAPNVIVVGSVVGNVGTVVTVGCAGDPSGLASCALGNLASGAGESYTIEVPVPAGSTDQSLSLMLSASSGVADPQDANHQLTEATEIDGEPPVITAIDSLGNTGDSSLDRCEEARVAIDTLKVTFDQSMNDPAGSGDPADVTNPGSYELIMAGDDQRLSTTQCGALAGDDQRLTAVAVTYDDATFTAGLRFAQKLANAPYRLLVCGDTLADSSGTVLDGDGDGTPGGDFSRYFRVDTENLFVHGHFDCNLNGWSEVATSEDEITFTAFDRDDALESGAAVVYQLASTTSFALGQCVDIPRPGNYSWSGGFSLRDLQTGDTLDITRACESYAQPGCVGAALGMADSFSEQSAVTGDDWKVLEPWTYRADSGAVSALCSIDLRLLNSGNELTVFLDEQVLTDHIMIDGFETGDTSMWSAAEP